LLLSATVCLLFLEHPNASTPAKINAPVKMNVFFSPDHARSVEVEIPLLDFPSGLNHSILAIVFHLPAFAVAR
jgi:hypothetical protein